jgi:AcrR family transcriptional regulator
MAGTVRMSAAERREAVLRAARVEFCSGGYSGTSTEAIAKRVGVSQPYLFRLFPSKKALYLATIERCFDSMNEMFITSAGELTGDDALEAMGKAYNALLDNKELLQMQLQTWATACQDDEVRMLARRRWSELWALVGRLSGADQERVVTFMGGGMLLNVLAALDLPRIGKQAG